MTLYCFLATIILHCEVLSDGASAISYECVGGIYVVALQYVTE